MLTLRITEGPLVEVHVHARAAQLLFLLEHQEQWFAEMRRKCRDGEPPPQHGYSVGPYAPAVPTTPPLAPSPDGPASS